MGLQIAPPTAQLHGWAFGKGIYFADMFEKSVGYCSCYNRATNNIYMLICEIIVGKMKKVLDNNLGELGLGIIYIYIYIENIDIIKAMGKRGPNENNSMRMVDGTEVLTGECIEYETKENKYIYLQNSEYIVFNPNQVRVRYLVQVTIIILSILNYSYFFYSSIIKEGTCPKDIINQRRILLVVIFC